MYHTEDFLIHCVYLILCNQPPCVLFCCCFLHQTNGNKNSIADTIYYSVSTGVKYR